MDNNPKHQRDAAPDRPIASTKRGRPAKAANTHNKRIAVSLPISQLEWIKSQGKPSRVIQQLIERVMVTHPGNDS
jgi:hypothetical protein